jgi:hypothetical protein
MKKDIPKYFKEDNPERNCPWIGGQDYSMEFPDGNGGFYYFHNQRIKKERKDEGLFVYIENESYISAERIVTARLFLKNKFGNIAANKKHLLNNGKLIPFYGLDAKPISFPKENRYKMFINPPYIKNSRLEQDIQE